MTRRNRPSRLVPRPSSDDLIWARGRSSPPGADGTCATFSSPRSGGAKRRPVAPWTCLVEEVDDHRSRSGPTAARGGRSAAPGEHVVRRTATRPTADLRIKAFEGIPAPHPEISIHDRRDSCGTAMKHRLDRQTNKAPRSWQSIHRRSMKDAPLAPMTCINALRHTMRNMTKMQLMYLLAVFSPVTGITRIGCRTGPAPRAHESPRAMTPGGRNARRGAAPTGRRPPGSRSPSRPARRPCTGSPGPRTARSARSGTGR